MSNGYTLAYLSMEELESIDAPNGAMSPVYVSGRFYKQSAVRFSNTVVVKEASDLVDIDSTKNYMIDGTIDMGSQSIEVPEGGISLSGLNGARDTSILTSSEDNYTMFTSPAGGYSGNVVLESCTIDLTGSNSQVFGLDNDGNGSALDVTGVNFGRSPVTTTLSLGELSDYRQLLLNNVGFIFIDDGLTFSGEWTGIAVTVAIAVGFPTATLFKEGTGFTVDNIRSDVNFLSVQPDSVLFDFQESAITSKAGFSLSNVRTSADDAVPNIAGSSSYARFRNCNGIKNTYVGGQWSITTEATTTISAADTPVKLAGTTTYTDMQWFTQTTDNAFVYDGEQTIEVECKGVISLSGGNNDQCSIFFRKYDDSTSSYVDAPRSRSTMNGGGGNRAESIPFYGYFTLDNNDRIEVWVENNTDSDNITGVIGGLASIEERAS